MIILLIHSTKRKPKHYQHTQGIILVFLFIDKRSGSIFRNKNVGSGIINVSTYRSFLMKIFLTQEFFRRLHILVANHMHFKIEDIQPSFSCITHKRLNT